MVTITEVAVGTWGKRKELVYKPCNDFIEKLGFVDAFGRVVSANRIASFPRRAYLEEKDGDVTYIKYDTESSPIFRVRQSANAPADPDIPGWGSADAPLDPEEPGSGSAQTDISFMIYGTTRRTFAVSQITNSDIEGMESAEFHDNTIKEIETTPGELTAVLVLSGYTVTKDDGFGGRVPFDENNGQTGTGANGIDVTISGRTYKAYGEFNLVSGTTKIYVTKEA